MDYQEWFSIGREQGFISPAVCSTHDGIPMSDEEMNEFDTGSDPCIHILRLYEDKQKRDEVEKNVPVWRV
jgi:hypothetical protein